MKVITLKQPWATLVITGRKKYEFRSWNTNYRGKILIHAGKTVDKEAMKRLKDFHLDFPTSRILGEVELIDCIKLDSDIHKKIIEEDPVIYGHRENRGGFAWVLENPREIHDERIVTGKLGIWNI